MSSTKKIIRTVQNNKYKLCNIYSDVIDNAEMKKYVM